MKRLTLLRKFILILREVSYRGTLLFTHPDAELRRRALAVSSAILACASKAADPPCGKCSVCAMSVNPDIIEYSPSFSAGGVELVRTLLARFRETPVVIGKRLLILHDIPNLSREALTTMLIELEEPPGNNVVLLSAADPLSVLSTIRSRALHLPIPDTFRNYPLSTHAGSSFLTTQSRTPGDPLVTRIDGELSQHATVEISKYRNIEYTAELLRLRRLYMSRRLSPELVRAFLAQMIYR
ncbi:MAG: hypothetical protein HY459_00570 [Parcubacteria group bacterium]|nr:hypothetical protein [Parcubacteria group bacterium]